MRRAVVFLIAAFFIICICPCALVHASDSGLEQQIDPEAGLDEDVRDQIGPYEDLRTEGFADRFRELFLSSLHTVFDGIGRDLKTAAILIAVVLLCRLLPEEDRFSGKAVAAVGALAITAACAGDLNSMIEVGTETVRKTNDYTTVLMPGLAALISVSGGVSGAGALYTGSVFFLELLMTVMIRLLVPLIYIFTAVSAAEAAFGQGRLSGLRDFIKWLCSAILKVILFVFTTYLTVTGLLAGQVDGVKLKAARMAVSGTIPMVGKILSEASQTLVSAAELLKTSVGVYGMLAIMGLCLVPVIRIGLQYVLLKSVGALCALIGSKRHVGLITNLSDAMGIVAGMTGTYFIMTLLALILCIKTVGL